MNWLNPSAPPRVPHPSEVAAKTAGGGDGIEKGIGDLAAYALGALGLGLAIYALTRDEGPKRQEQTPWHYGG